METHPHYYPTLSLIDRATGMPPARFADDPAAPRLELRARALLADYWSDSAWLTGVVSEVALCIVREILAHERIALGDEDPAAQLTDVPIAQEEPEINGILVINEGGGASYAGHK